MSLLNNLLLRRRVWLALLLLVPVPPVVRSEEPFHAATASAAELVQAAVRYGATPERRAAKDAARKECFARGPEALREMMKSIHVENVELSSFAEQVSDQMDGPVAAAVLLEFLDAPELKTRKFAAYFLGDHDTPEHGARLTPLLKDDEAAGAAIRALGKWGVTNAVPLIIPFLEDPKERRRVAAANALRDIGDPAALPALRAALDDPYFTVRRTAARAIKHMESE